MAAVATLITLGNAVPAQLGYDNINESESANIPETAVNIRVVRSFRKSFPQVSGEKWNMANDHYFVMFSTGEIKHSIVYTKKGSLDYALKMYREKHLPRSIRNVVKSLYYDYTINTAQELHINRKTIYIIQLSDSSGWISVRVCDGEIDEIGHLRKN
jgi:hypothetical protein